MQQHHTNDQPISEHILNLIILFQNSLATVSFPEINGEILEQLAEEVRCKTNELAELVENEKNIRSALEESQNTLMQKAIKALAYAKVYAEGNEELKKQLEKINLGKSTKNSKKSFQDKEDNTILLAKTYTNEDKKSLKATKKGKDELSISFDELLS